MGFCWIAVSWLGVVVGVLQDSCFWAEGGEVFAAAVLTLWYQSLFEDHLQVRMMPQPISYRSCGNGCSACLHFLGLTMIDPCPSTVLCGLVSSRESLALLQSPSAAHTGYFMYSVCYVAFSVIQDCWKPWGSAANWVWGQHLLPSPYGFFASSPFAFHTSWVPALFLRPAIGEDALCVGSSVFLIVC